MIVGVSVDQEAANLGAFLKQMQLYVPVVHDKAHAVADRFKPPRMPSSYIVDRNGIVRHVHGGFRSGDEAQARVRDQRAAGRVARAATLLSLRASRGEVWRKSASRSAM